MKIAIIALFFSFYTATSAFWLWGRGAAKRNCAWLSWTDGLCMEVAGQTYKYGKKGTREKVLARHGGAECVGSASRITPCTEEEYRAMVFLRTVSAKLSGGSSSRRTLVTGSAAKKCVDDFNDNDGEPTMSGRNCPTKGRKKRRAIDDLARMQRRAKRQAILSTKNRDVLFLIDESGSVGKEHFKLLMRMVRALANSFCGPIRISKSLTRVGVLTFNLEQHPQIDFDEFFHKAAFINATETNVTYYGYPSAGATCLVEALKFTRSDMLTKARGARPHIVGTERLVILLTDGCANCVNNGDLESNLNTLGAQFTADGVPIITFLIAPKPSYCFKIMKGLSDGSQCYQQFAAKSWGEFKNMTIAIENSPCMDSWIIGPPC